MPQDRAGAVVLDQSFFAPIGVPIPAAQAGRQAGSQASKNAFDFAYPDEALDAEAQLMDEYVKGVGSLKQMFQTGMAKGLNPARPDLSNPESVALNRAFTNAFAENYQMANALRQSRDAREKAAELRLREGLSGAMSSTGDMVGFNDIQQNIIQTRPFDAIVDEFNGMGSEFSTRTGQRQHQQARQLAEQAIDRLEQERINQGDNPEEVKIAADAARAKLRQSIFEPKVFAPTGGGGGSDRGQKLSFFRARALDMTGQNGAQQAMQAAMAMRNETVDYKGQEYVVDSGHYHTTPDGKNQVSFELILEKPRVKTVDEVIREQGFEDKKGKLFRGAKTAEQQAEEWIKNNTSKDGNNPNAYVNTQRETVTFEVPSSTDPATLASSSGFGQLVTFLNSSRAVSDKFMLEEVVGGLTPQGVSLPNQYGTDQQPQPDANGVITGPVTGKVKGGGQRVSYNGRTGTYYETTDGKKFFVPDGQ